MMTISQPTSDEPEERLRHIRANRQVRYGGMGQITSDIDFLLSLIDSQAVGGSLKGDDELVAEMNLAAESLVRDWYCDSQHRDELVNEIAITLTAAHRRAEANASTTMRDKCVGAIRKMQATIRRRNRDRDASNRPDVYRINILEQVVEQLQFLTLDEEKQ